MAVGGEHQVSGAGATCGPASQNANHERTLGARIVWLSPDTL